MAKTLQIKARSWVHKGDELVELSTLPLEEREAYGQRLAVEYLNALYAGRAVFYVQNAAEG